MVFVVAGLLLALLQQYGVAPRIVARENLRLWHSVGTLMYVLQWLCAAVVLWHTSTTSTALPSSENEGSAAQAPPSLP